MTIFKSKKFIATLSGAVLGLVAWGMGMPVEYVGLLMSPFLTYIGAQGIADIGKERAKIEKSDDRPGV